MSARRTITVITGSRAEFGLLSPVMRAISARRELRLRLIVTGQHIAMGTSRDIELAGFRIDAHVPMQRQGEVGRWCDVASLGYGVAGIGAVLAVLRPDVVLVLGDRIEALAGACAASVGGVLLGHIHGGDRAEGVADEAMRHAISKLAHLHFAASELSRKRLVRMGEDPARVFNVGSPALDGLDQIAPADDERLRQFGIDGGRPFVVVLQHPVGASNEQEAAWMSATLKATASVQRLVLGPNSDAGAAGVRTALRRARIAPVEHIERTTFIGILKRAAALVGNSSAGMIETSAIMPGGLPVVNIGQRQGGRERPGNVIDCPYGLNAVRTALRTALIKPPKARKAPFGTGQAGPNIAKLLATINLDKLSTHKHNQY